MTLSIAQHWDIKAQFVINVALIVLPDMLSMLQWSLIPFILG